MPKAGPGAGAAAFGLDLLDPPVRKSDAGLDLPVPKSGSGLDLPVPKSGSGLDLPVPKSVAGLDLPVPKSGSGLDLPVPKSGSGLDLPVPKSGSGLGPGPTAGDWDGALQQSGYELPVPKPAGTASAVSLPMPKAARAPGADLPVPRPHGGPDLPTPAGGGSFRSVLPVPVDSGVDVPTPVGEGVGELPMPASDQWGHLPVPTGTFDSPGFDDDDAAPLELGDTIGGPGSAFPELAPPPPVYPRSAPAADPQMDSAAPPLQLDLPAAPPPPAPAAVDGKADKKGPKAPGGRAVVGILGALLVLLVGGGLALGLTPFGFFGLAFLTGRMGASSDENLTSEVIVQARQKVALDTYRDHRDAVGRVELAQRQGKGSDGLAAYALFLYELHAIRFGESKQYATSAERLATTLPFDTAESPALKLGAAARALRQLEPAKAAQLVQAVLQAVPNNEDALQLRGELELAGGASAEALASFQRLSHVEKQSPRALYGIARAHLAKGEREAASKVLDQLVERQPNHVGALLEKAQLAFEAEEAGAATELIAMVESDKAPFASPVDTARALELKASIHLKSGRLGEALESFREAVKLNDRSVRAHLGMGEIYHARGEEAEALANYQMASRIAPTNLDATLGASRALITMVGEDNLQTARNNLEAALRAHPEDPRVHYLLGRTLEELSHPEDAQSSFEKAIELDRNYLEPYLGLADLHLERGRVEDGMAVLDRARRELPDDPRIATALGQGYLDRGDYQEAERQFRLALSAAPEHLPALFHLGVALRRMGRLNDARSTFERLGRMDSRYPGLIVQQGLVLERTGQPEEALSIYRAELERNPEDLDMKLRVAAALVLVNNCDEAVALLRDVVRERPDSAEGLFYQGRCSIMGGHPDDAERALRRAVEIDGNNGEYRAYLGMAYLQTGTIEHATVELQRAIELDPTNAVAYWQRGALALRSAAAATAVRDLERALELAPGLTGVYRSLAQAYDQMRRPADAIRYFELAVRSDPDDFQSHYFLAQIVTDQRGAASGLPHYQRAVELGRRMEPRPRYFFEAIFGQGSLLHELGRDQEARRVLQEYVETAPTTSVDRAEAVALLRRLGRGDVISE